MLKRLFPFLSWRFAKGDVRADFVSGLTVALVLIPQSMAYAQLAGLPAVVGLYAACIPVMIGALWGSSHHLQTGPVAMTSLLTGTILMQLAVPESATYVALAGLLAVMVGCIRLFVGATRLAVLANFLSKPVIDGFVHAGVLVIASSQVSKLFGLEMAKGGWYLRNLWDLLCRLGELNLTAAVLGCASIVLLVLVKRFLPKLPASLVVVALATLSVSLLGLHDPERMAASVGVVGHIPMGLPRPVSIDIDWGMIGKMLPGAFVIAFVGFMEMCGVAKAVAVQSRQRLDLNQELIGQGLAAVSSGLTGGYTVSGSLSRTALNYASGAKTGLSAVFTGMFMVLFLMFLAGAIYCLPTATLGAVIIVAVVKLLNFKRLFSYWKVSRWEGLVALLTFAATLLFAPQLQNGILLGAALSIVIFLFQTMKPNVALLGRHEDGSYRTYDRYDLAIDPRMPVIRFDGRLFFANVSYFEDMLLDTCGKFQEAEFIAIDCQGINAIDATGVEMLGEMVTILRENHVELLFCQMKTPVRQLLQRAGLFDKIGEENFFHRIDTARIRVG
ncbi:SulP family inorganic anion transporter [Pontiella sulfatireligans]|uniref:Putative sulfate transporter n=1 Tax=Pontiella sulfatireligans TaxID=2750658 RepID=A0A6C2UHZ8_9BACT|nr:SulP family inorganic anion transporter [Pontiella sulfatireligans]VGO19820.1 putative sulfate transporter [Pontiella sulfatireligans]